MKAKKNWLSSIFGYSAALRDLGINSEFSKINTKIAK